MIAKYFTLFITFSILYPSYDKDIKLPISQLYNFEIDKSINSLEKMSIEYPEDALISFLKISAYWQRSLLNDNPESSYKVIKDGIRQLTPFYLDMIHRYPEDQSYNLFLGSLYGLKARIHLAQSEWMSLIISGAKGFKYIKKAISKDPSLYDAYMPIGTLEYVLCRSSSPIQLIGEVFALQSDCNEAIGKLEMASDSARYSWIEARNVLSYIYLYVEKDYHKALKHSHSLSEEFPGHPFFAYLEAESLLRLERYDDFTLMNRRLMRFYENGSKNQRTECYDKYLYLNALRSYQKEEYYSAIEYSTKVINDYNTEFEWILGYAHLIRGKSYEMLSDRAAAVIDYQNAVKYLDNWPDKEEAENLIHTPISVIIEDK